MAARWLQSPTDQCLRFRSARPFGGVRRRRQRFAAHCRRRRALENSHRQRRDGTVGCRRGPQRRGDNLLLPQPRHSGESGWRGHLAGSRFRPAPQIYGNAAGRFAARRSSAGRNRARHLPQPGRWKILAARGRGRHPGAAHRAIAARRLLLAGRDRRRRPVPVHRLRGQLRKQWQPGGGAEPLRRLLRSGIAESHRGGGLGRRGGDHGRPRQDLAGAQRRASQRQRLERGLRPCPARPHLRQRARGRHLCVRRQRRRVVAGRSRGKLHLPHEIRTGGAPR